MPFHRFLGTLQVNVWGRGSGSRIWSNPLNGIMSGHIVVLV